MSYTLTSADPRRLVAPPGEENIGGWRERHASAIATPRYPEAAVIHLFSALDEYACAHNRRWDSLIGQDFVLGPVWETMVTNLKELLNGETGRLNCGTVESAIRQLMLDHGYVDPWDCVYEEHKEHKEKEQDPA